ncbi:RNA-binding protein Raly isoform 3-T4 [Odontesthes bonariensis]
MVIDFRRKKKTPSQPLKIKGEVVEEVDDYKYLGVVIGNRLDWASNTDAVCKKGMSRLYFLRKLGSFNVCSKMLETFYHSVVAGAIFFAAVCWGSSIRASDSNRLDKIIRKAGSVLGQKLESLETMVERRTRKKLLSIMDNIQHPLHHTVDRQRSTFSHRLLQLRCRRNRYRKSFLPHAITLYNNRAVEGETDPGMKTESCGHTEVDISKGRPSNSREPLLHMCSHTYTDVTLQNTQKRDRLDSLSEPQEDTKTAGYCQNTSLTDELNVYMRIHTHTHTVC